MVVITLYVTVIIPCCIGDPDDQLGIMVRQVPSKFTTMNYSGRLHVACFYLPKFTLI